MVYLHLTFTEDILASLLQSLFLAFAFFRHALPLCSSSLSAKVMLCLLSSEYQLPFSGVSDKVISLKNSLWTGGLSGLVVESLGSPVFLSVPAIRPSDQPVVDLVVASSSHFTPDIKQ